MAKSQRRDYNRPRAEMSKTLHLACAAGVALLLCSGARAQVRGGTASMAGLSARIPARQMQPARMTSMARISSFSANAIQAGRPVRFTVLSPAGRVISSNVSFAHDSGVPGLGFDYPHLAAISGNSRFNFNSRHHSGRDGRRQATSFIPILYGGYSYLGGPLDYSPDYPSDYPDQQQPPQAVPQVIVVQQPAPVAESSGDSRNDNAIPAADSASAEPVRDVGEFILIRRDGKVLFASAYSVIGPNVRYITPEGIRRTVPLAELDVDSTRSMNEARGATLELPD